MAQMSMADLLAKQESKNKVLTVFRGQEVEGVVAAILPQELIVDLGTKSEGVLPKKELPKNTLESLKIGSKIKAFVAQVENESGQISLSIQKPVHRQTLNTRGGFSTSRKNVNWQKFEEALKNNEILKGKAIEVNKGGLIVEVNDVRGFLPTSQLSLSQTANLEELIGQTIEVKILEIDPNQNRLIFSQHINISKDIKEALNKLKAGDVVEGEIATIFTFGIYIMLPQNVEGFIHISEVSWDKIDNLTDLYKVGDVIKVKVLSVDMTQGRVNLSIKQMSEDPFGNLVEKIHPNDIVKGKVTKINSTGVTVDLGGGVEGVIYSSKIDRDKKYQIDQDITCIVDTVDLKRRKLSLAPFITNTKDLIYK